MTPVLHFNLSEEVKRLKGEKDWTSGKRSITLTKQGDRRVVLMALRAGATVDEHRAAGALTAHVMEGRVRFTVAEEAWTLVAGELLTLEPGLPHEVSALDESVLLLTL